jgi:hypothetical protein
VAGQEPGVGGAQAAAGAGHDGHLSVEAAGRLESWLRRDVLDALSMA